MSSSQTASNKRDGIRRILAPTALALKKNWRPILLIQLCAVVVVFCYLWIPSFRAQLDAFSAAKQKAGLWTSVVMMWISSIVVPEIAIRVTRAPLEKWTGRELAFRLFYFTFIALFLEGWYQGVAALYSGPNTALVLICKGIADQFLFSPLVSMPFASITFLWRDSNFDATLTARRARQGEFYKRYITSCFTCWCFWPPIVAVLYLLPAPLQYVLSVICNAAWSILYVRLSQEIEKNRHLPTFAETSSL